MKVEAGIWDGICYSWMPEKLALMNEQNGKKTHETPLDASQNFFIRIFLVSHFQVVSHSNLTQLNLAQVKEVPSQRVTAAV